MKSLVIGLVAGLMAVGAVAFAETDTESPGEDVLVVRYACLVGGREAGSAPISSGVLGREELSDYLLEWAPDSDNKEVDLYVGKGKSKSRDNWIAF